MADNNAVHIGENSPEQVAFKLMQQIANVEGKEFYVLNGKQVDREWILRTYMQCLRASRNPFAPDDALQAGPTS